MRPLLGKSVWAAMDCALQNFASFQQSVELDMGRRLKSLLPSGLRGPLVFSFPLSRPFLAIVRKGSLLFSVTVCVSWECSYLSS